MSIGGCPLEDKAGQMIGQGQSQEARTGYTMGPRYPTPYDQWLPGPSDAFLADHHPGDHPPGMLTRCPPLAVH